ncbi:hypothetical protein ACRN9C_16305 [Shewanella frigidimarina]|uniref:hypothetical protein n=1 Tax=Shewanella frigidimarina TaxID=56812 RepID=UPI003D7A1E07
MMLKKIAFLSITNISGPILAFISLPFITRLYNVDHLGSYHWILTLGMLGSIFLGFQVYNGLLSELNEEDLKRKFYANIALVLLSSIILILVGVIGFFINFLSLLDIISVYFISLTTVFNLIFMTYFSRISLVNVLAKVTFIKSTVTIFFSISLSFLIGSSVEYLVISYLLGELSVMYFLFLPEFKFNKKKLVLGFEDQKYLFCSDGEFARFYLPSQLLSTFMNSAMIFFIKFHSVSLLGIYSILFRLIAVPTYSVANAVKSIFYINFIKIENDKIKYLILIVLCCYVFSLTVSSMYFLLDLKFISYYLGSDFYRADEYFPYFVFWVFTSFTNIFPIEILKNSNRNKSVFLGEIFTSLLKLLVLIYIYSINFNCDLLKVIPLFFGVINLIVIVFYIFESWCVFNKK